MSSNGILMKAPAMLPQFVSAGVGILAFLILCFSLNAAYNIWFHPLSKYPGPRWQAASRLPCTIQIFRGTATQNTARLHELYGHAVRITPNTLSFTSSQAWDDIYGLRRQNGRGNFPKDPSFYMTPPGEADTIVRDIWLGIDSNES
ncbi:trichothecene C-15 hydroxylase [Colletotrichum asianum]|uniref:Trichothecene C-15 hydroxylase n=1 Tax=Colletotrichum asianum TaxID=702518 RepID=A0A8H3WNS3_9PEZI|nr:trichothecene C-15 hydroxylase [Colletotrichum asianum]